MYVVKTRKKRSTLDNLNLKAQHLPLDYLNYLKIPEK